VAVLASALDSPGRLPLNRGPIELTINQTMFWRLFFTYFLLVTGSVGTVGLIILRRNDGEEIYAEVLGAVVAITLLAIVPAILLARRFTHPLNDLTDGANRLATGDLGHTIRIAGSKEFSALARTFNDMSEALKQSFAQVDRDKQQLRTILSGMVEGVVALGADRRVIFANERAGDLLEFASATAIGRTLEEITSHRGVSDLVDAALRASEPHRAELILPGDEPRHLAVYAARLTNPESPDAVLVFNDVSELRQLERLRQDFVANVSHELKTPLTVIKSNIEALQDGAADDVTVREEFLSRVTFEAERLEALIQDLLRLSKIESGQMGLELESIPMAEEIALGLDRQATRAEAKTLQLIEVPPREPVNVRADHEALTTILDNLIDNAIKYTTSGGKVTLRWTATPTHVTLDVQDTGIGIAEADLPRVFERFYRADKARSRAAGGTGLGLAIVKHLVQAMKGSVRVTSELGKGSTFSITLPRAE
jgi:two-component system phosphate regulon sensor histidine kinase PhoR